MIFVIFFYDANIQQNNSQTNNFAIIFIEFRLYPIIPCYLSVK
jgi:hypothetical protein